MLVASIVPVFSYADSQANGESGTIYIEYYDRNWNLMDSTEKFTVLPSQPEQLNTIISNNIYEADYTNIKLYMSGSFYFSKKLNFFNYKENTDDHWGSLIKYRALDLRLYADSGNSTTYFYIKPGVSTAIDLLEGADLTVYGNLTICNENGVSNDESKASFSAGIMLENGGDLSLAPGSKLEFGTSESNITWTPIMILDDTCDIYIDNATLNVYNGISYKGDGIFGLSFNRGGLEVNNSHINLIVDSINSQESICGIHRDTFYTNYIQEITIKDSEFVIDVSSGNWNGKNICGLDLQNINRRDDNTTSISNSKVIIKHSGGLLENVTGMRVAEATKADQDLNISNLEMDLQANTKSITGIDAERYTLNNIILSNPKFALNTTSEKTSNICAIRNTDNGESNLLKIPSGGYFYGNSQAEDSLFDGNILIQGNAYFSSYVHPMYFGEGYKCEKLSSPVSSKINNKDFSFSYTSKADTREATNITQNKTDTLRNIIGNANSGDKIKILRDVPVSNSLAVNNDLFLDLGGYSVAAAQSSCKSLFNIQSGKTLTIAKDSNTGGRCKNTCGVIASGSGKIETYVADFEYKNDASNEREDSNQFEYVADGTEAVAHKNGTFSTDVSRYCANGQTSIYDSNLGKYKVVPGPYFASQSITLNGSLGISFTILVRELNYTKEQLGIRVVYNDASGEHRDYVESLDSDVITSPEENKYTIKVNNIAAKQMTDKVKVQIVRIAADTINQDVKDWDKVYAEMNYSIKDYIYSKIEKAAKDNKLNDDKDLYKLLFSLLKYGSEAQEYFNYKTDNLAFNETELLRIASQSQIEEYTSTWDEIFGDILDNYETLTKTEYEKNETKEQRPIHSLDLDGEIAINYYFENISESEDNVIVYKKDASSEAIVGGVSTESEKVPFTKNGVTTDYERVKVSGIRVQDIADVFAIQTKDSEGNTFVTRYSVYDYMYDMMGSQSESQSAVKKLMGSLYVYSQCAKDYLAGMD